MIQDKSGRDIFTPREELSALIWEWQKWYGEDFDTAVKSMRSELQAMKNKSVSQTMTPPSRTMGQKNLEYSSNEHNREDAQTALPLRQSDQREILNENIEQIQRIRKAYGISS